MATTSDTPEGPFTSGEGIIVETPAEHNNFPPFDASTFASQLLWFAITFAVLYYVMAKVALPRLAGIIEGRRDRIAADLDTAERLKGESEDAARSYEKALAQARANASSIAETARTAAKTKADAQRGETERDLAAKLTAAETRITDIKNRALGRGRVDRRRGDRGGGRLADRRQDDAGRGERGGAVGACREERQCLRTRHSGRWSASSCSSASSST